MILKRENIITSLSAGVSLYLRSRISQKLHVQPSRNFLFMFLKLCPRARLSRRQYYKLCTSGFVDDVIFR